MTFPVKYIRSTMQGAPTMSGSAGSMTTLLDAALVNGFNILTPSSIVVATGVATVTYAVAHGYIAHDIILVAGATPTALNGEQRVVSATSTTLTFATTAIDGAATGVLETRTAPVGSWEKVFTGLNKAVYRSTDATGTRLYLRVDDTGSNNALWVGYESMTDVDTGTAPFPTVAQLATGVFARKSSTADATARTWYIVADSKTIYMFANWNASTATSSAWYRFGEFASLKSGDAYNCMISAHTVVTPSNAGSSPTQAECNFSGDQPYIARSYTQIGSAVAARQGGSTICGYFGSSGQAYPSPVNNGLILHYPVVINEGVAASPTRGTYKGIYQPVQTAPLAAGDVRDDVEGLPGRRVLLLRIDNTNTEGRIAIDTTGPWV